jgi:hypothetical protein
MYRKSATNQAKVRQLGVRPAVSFNVARLVLEQFHLEDGDVAVKANIGILFLIVNSDAFQLFAI